MKNQASAYFGAVPKTHNCAQSVAAGAGREDLLPELASCGGGRAPGGLCGALYALLKLAPESAHDRLRRDFAARAGAETCREIKTGSKFPCAECVRLAAELSEEFL
ncbi:MAG: redox-active protein [Lentisphaeria bacterium]|nr:redox-active protein [Lentisphaeria bacterium]